MKSLIILILGVLEPYLGPIASPSITEELRELNKTINSTNKEILELKANLELEGEREKKSDTISTIIGVSIFVSLIFLYCYSGGDFSNIVGDVGNSIGRQISEVGKIMNENVATQLSNNNSSMEEYFKVISKRIDLLENHLSSLINRLTNQVARASDSKKSNKDFFDQWNPKDSD